MSLMQWNESMAVGVGVIDQQHRKVIDLINQLNDAMSVGKGKDVLGKILTELANYTQRHFSTEEELFDQYDYPDGKSHIQRHLHLMQKTHDLKKSFESGKTIISVQTMNFLKDWWNNHIMKIDKQYGPFLNSKGVK